MHMKDDTTAMTASKDALWTDTPGLQRTLDLLMENGRFIQKCFAALPSPIPGLGFGNTGADASYVGTCLTQARGGQTCSIAESRLGLFTVRWNQYGYPLFSLTDGLVAKLLLTDPSGINGEEVRFPFPAFLVEVPDGYFKSMFVGETKSLSLIAVQDHLLEEKSSSGVGSWEMLRNMRDAALERNYRGWEMFLQGRRMDGGQLFAFTEAPPSEGSIGDWLRQHTPEESNYSNLPVEGDDNQTLLAARLLVTNLLIYLNTLPKLPTPHVSKAKPHKGVVGGISRYEVGHKIKLSAELRAAAKDRGSSTAVEGWKLRSRYTVRGHWRNQPYGPGRSGRRRIWIDPHWKGPEGEQLRREYEVSK